MEVVITEVVIMEVDQGTPPQKWSSWKLTRVPPGSGHHGSGHHGSGPGYPPEVVIMEVDQGTPPQKWSSWKWTRVPPPPHQKWSSWKLTRVPPPEVVIMEVDQGTPIPPPPPIWTDHTSAIGSRFSFEKRISTCIDKDFT